MSEDDETMVDESEKLLIAYEALLRAGLPDDNKHLADARGEILQHLREAMAPIIAVKEGPPQDPRVEIAQNLMKSTVPVASTGLKECFTCGQMKLGEAVLCGTCHPVVKELLSAMAGIIKVDEMTPLDKLSASQRITQAGVAASLHFGFFAGRWK